MTDSSTPKSTSARPSTAPEPTSENPGADPTPHRDGQTTPHVDGEVAPRLPHERDESADSQPNSDVPLMDQARKDLERGLVDTDRGPKMDELYENEVRPDGGQTRDRKSPKE